MKSRYDTSDVLQEATLQLWLDIEGKQREAEKVEEPFLRTIARGHQSKMIRHHQAQCRSVDWQEVLPDSIETDSMEADERFIDNETSLRLIDAMSSLDTCDRQIIGLRFVEGWSFNQIAHSVNLPAHTVRRRCSAAINDLARELNSQ